MTRTGSITVTAFLLLFGSTVGASAQQKKKVEKREQQRERVEHRQEVQGRQRLSDQEQQQRIREQQQRWAQYQGRLNRQLQLAEQENARLQQQRRLAQYRVQQQYLANLQRQQEQLRNQRNYSNDPYIYTASTYRYNVGGVTRLTNQYGADELRRAVQYGYNEGYQYGRADRQDGYGFDYRNAYAYRDANYGYSGNYVDQIDYNAYFREGFRRGYEDGFYSRSQYGTVSNGSGSILSNVLSLILGLTSIK